MTTPRKAWTETDVELLAKRLLIGDPIADIAGELSRTPGAIEAKARSLGLGMGTNPRTRKEPAKPRAASPFGRVF